MIYSYIRVSTEKQTYENQRFEIDTWAKAREIKAINSLARDSLSRELSVHLAYASIRGDTLFFVFRQQEFKTEFLLSKGVILNRLRELYKQRGFYKKGIVFKQINAVCVYKKEQKTRVSKRAYVERARGDFVVVNKNAAIRASFAKIKKQIKDNLRESNG